jgi:hypothetical protein
MNCKNTHYSRSAVSVRLMKTLLLITDCDGMLWTDKYMPLCASEIVGNWSASKKLRDWLMQWKERIARFTEKSTTHKSSGHKQNATSNNASKYVEGAKHMLTVEFVVCLQRCINNTFSMKKQIR